MMSRARFNSIYSGMTSVSKKVYEAVPMNEAWNTSKIAAELQRCGLGIDFRIVAGCLNSLCSAGLINEIGKAEFKREGIKTEAANKPTNELETDMGKQYVIKTVAQSAPAKKLAPLDRLGELAQRAANMANMLKELASDISDAAVDIQSQMETGEEDVKKLRQLQTLLKSIGAEETH